MGRIFFISGIDTGVGKTVVVGLMARYLKQRQVEVATCKMIQTGNVGFSEDLELHRKLMGIQKLPEDGEGLTAPQIFAFPASPLLAARLENRQVDTDKIVRAANTLAERYPVVLVEGAGGLHVPLAAGILAIDIARAEKWPVILVSSGKLGSVNHTLLSLEALKNRRMKLAGVAYNHAPGADPVIDRDSAEFIAGFLDRNGFSAPLLRVPEIDLDSPSDVDFKPFFGV